MIPNGLLGVWMAREKKKEREKEKPMGIEGGFVGGGGPAKPAGACPRLAVRVELILAPRADTRTTPAH